MLWDKNFKGSFVPERYVFSRGAYNKLRKKRKMTLADLSIKTGIGEFTLCRYGRGATVPGTPSIALCLAVALGCDVSDLYIMKKNTTEVNL